MTCFLYMMINVALWVDVADIWKKGVLRAKPVQAYIGLQRVANP